MNEIDIPCSDCGTTLVEQTIDTRDLPPIIDGPDQVTVAMCRTCGARYYPAQTLALLGQSTTESRTP